MITVDVRVAGEEVLFRLDQLPRRIRAELTAKFSAIFSALETDLLSKTPGKYFDPAYVQSGIEGIGSTLVGFFEVGDKPGVYAIYPSKASVLRFLSKSGEIVFARKVLYHPFPKGGLWVERFLLEAKPWIFDQLEDAVIEAL